MIETRVRPLYAGGGQGIGGAFLLESCDPCRRTTSSLTCGNGSTLMLVLTSSTSRMCPNLQQALPMLSVSVGASLLHTLLGHRGDHTVHVLGPSLAPSASSRRLGSGSQRASKRPTSPWRTEHRVHAAGDLPLWKSFACWRANQRSADAAAALDPSAANRGIFARWRQHTSVTLQVGSAHVLCEAVTASSPAPDLELDPLHELQA